MNYVFTGEVASSRYQNLGLVIKETNRRRLDVVLTTSKKISKKRAWLCLPMPKEDSMNTRCMGCNVGCIAYTPMFAVTPTGLVQQ